MWCLATWFSGRLGSTRLKVGTGGLRGLFQPYDSVISVPLLGAPFFLWEDSLAHALVQRDLQCPFAAHALASQAIACYFFVKRRSYVSWKVMRSLQCCRQQAGKDKCHLLLCGEKANPLLGLLLFKAWGALGVSCRTMGNCGVYLEGISRWG